jgi:hypothetical protein
MALTDGVIDGLDNNELAADRYHSFPDHPLHITWPSDDSGVAGLGQLVVVTSGQRGKRGSHGRRGCVAGSV